MENPTEHKKYVYALGLRAMWDAFRYSAHKDGMDIDAALERLHTWLDSVINPWVNDDVEVIGHIKWDGLPLPPGVEKPPDGRPEPA